MSLQEFKKRASLIVEKIDQVSRTRALVNDESALLEHCIGVVDGRISETDRLPHRAGIVIARLGIRRAGEFARYESRPNKRAVAAAMRRKANFE